MSQRVVLLLLCEQGRLRGGGHRGLRAKVCAYQGATFSDTSLRALQRLSVYFETLELELKQDGPYAGCLYGVIAQTSAGRSALVRDALAISFGRWETSIRELLTQAQYEDDIAGDEDVSDLCACIIEAYEGALIRVKATGDIAAFTRFRIKGLQRLMANMHHNGRVVSEDGR